MDPGIDDALALILALKSPEVRIIGITTVAGNAPVEMTGSNARRVLEHLNAGDIPVAAGAAKPLRRPLEDALGYHGPDGLGDSSLPPPTVPLHPGPAWDFLAAAALEAPGEITLLATGPLTNVTYAFEHHRQLPEFLAGVVLMGGAYGLTPCGKGNRTPAAEFNIWQDPEAARVVFNSGAGIFGVGLDVSMDPAACLGARHLERIRTGQTPAACLAAQLVEYEVRHHGCCRMHDPLALAVLLDPSLFDFVSGRVEVVEDNGPERGATRITPLDNGQGSSGIFRPARIASAVDGARFLELFISRILDERHV